MLNHHLLKNELSPIPSPKPRRVVPLAAISGFSMLEILITLVVVSIALLSIGALQTKSLQYSYPATNAH